MISRMIKSNSSTALVKYLLDEKAHNTELTSDRNLAVATQNIQLGRNNKINSLYVASQMYGVQKAAKNKNKKTKADHLVISFSDDDFPEAKGNKLKKQAQQAMKLVTGFLSKHFPKTTQYLAVIQRDGDGKKLHAHVALNSVLTDGKVMNMKYLSMLPKTYKKEHVAGLRSNLDNYLLENFERVTGRKFEPVKSDYETDTHKSSEQQIASRTGYVWKDELKAQLANVMTKANSFEEFKELSKSAYNIDIAKRRASVGKDENGKKIYRQAVTYSFTGQDGKKHKSRDYAKNKGGGTRGLGLAFTPNEIKNAIEQRLERENLTEIQNLNEILDINQTESEVTSNATKQHFEQPRQRDTEEEFEFDFGKTTVKRDKEQDDSTKHKQESHVFTAEQYNDRTREIVEQTNRTVQRQLEEDRKRKKELERADKKRRKQLADKQRQQQQVEQHGDKTEFSVNENGTSDRSSELRRQAEQAKKLDSGPDIE